MVVRSVERSPEVETYNENHQPAFDRFRLRPLNQVQRLMTASREPYVLFRPLCDTHRTVELLERLRTGSAPRALWVYRSAEGRARSAVAKFGDQNRRLLRDLAAGRCGDRWHARGLSPDSLALIRGLDWSTVDPLSAGALFWYVRSRLYVELGLAGRDCVLPVSYDAMVADAAGETRRLCAFPGFPYHPRLVPGISPRLPATARVSGIDSEIAARCPELTGRLEAARRSQTASSATR